MRIGLYLRRTAFYVTITGRGKFAAASGKGNMDFLPSGDPLDHQNVRMPQVRLRLCPALSALDPAVLERILAYSGRIAFGASASETYS